MPCSIRARIGKILFYCALPYLHLLASRQPRLRGILIDTSQHVLLIRNWFGSQQWELPGGGIKHNESPKRALVRELSEETGLTIAINQLHFVHEYMTKRRIAPLRLTFYSATVPTQPIRHKNKEILELGWFPISHLPPNCDQTVHDTLQIVVTQI